MKDINPNNMTGLHSFQNIKSNDLLENLIHLIEVELKDFSKSKEFKDILAVKKNENQHSLSYCTYMTNKCKSKFYFALENPQKGSSNIDIAIYYGSNIIFTIEAKLFPTPKGTKKYPRHEYEYVYGKGGGIQRFKDGKHGVDNADNYLKESGMIAYVKENNFDFWFQKVNQWISDAKWSSSEQLEKQYFDSTAKLMSRHSRRDKSKFILHHFWVKV